MDCEWCAEVYDGDCGCQDDENDCCNGCYCQGWFCSECANVEQHEADEACYKAERKERERLEAIEAAVAAFGEGARG